MKRVNRLLAIVLIVLVAILFYRNTPRSDKPVKSEPAKVESVLGTELNRVTLTAKAAERLDIQTVPVRKEWVALSGRVQTVVPYSSVIYGLHGETWVYTSPEPLTFVRHSIIIDYIDADLAVLSDGPPLGTLVVTVGVAELYGIDTGVGK